MTSARTRAGVRGPVGRLVAGAAALLVSAGLVVAPSATAPAAAAVPSSFTFSGSGWGHGLGMSQYGAYGQALDGRSAKQILEHYYAPAKVSTTSENPVLRVQVLSGETSVTVKKKRGDWRVRIDGADRPVINTDATSLTFTMSNGRVRVKGADSRFQTTTSPGSRLWLEWTGTNSWDQGTSNYGLVEVPKAHAGSGAVTYRHGRLTFSPLDGKINVVNDVRLEDYLRGLAEMPSSWPSAALQAQAIAGRTFALRQYRSGLKDHYAHLTDEVSSQKFTGWNKENEATYGTRWTAAVTASKGRVLRLNGNLVTTYYSSSSGGQTQNSEEVWGRAKEAHLRSRDDHWAIEDDVKNPYAEWTETLTQKEVASIFGLPDVASLRVTKRAASGAVMQVQATSSSGRTKNLLEKPATDHVRTRLGLRSPYFSIGSRSSVERLAGDDRYGTAVAIGRAAFPSGDEVVLVSGAQGNLVDGLVAAPFARERKAPVLLATKDELPAATRAEIQRRSPDLVWLVGGRGVLSDRLVRELRDLGIDDLRRLAGDDRYDTAAAVARQMGSADTVVIASGAPANLIDATASGGPAARIGAPILLTQGDRLGWPARGALRAVGADRTVVVGGSGVLSGEVVGQLRNGGWSPTRVAGDDRYGTAAAVASHFARSVGTGTAVLASGRDANLVDSLTGGVLGHVTLLTNGGTVPAATDRWFAAREVAKIRVAGGKGVVPTAVVEKVR